MDEYIKREEIRRAYEKLTRSYVNGNPYIADWRFDEMIEKLPADDVAPVVRCRECKHHEDEEIGMVYCPNAFGGWVRENWFCADGERKEGAD